MLLEVNHLESQAVFEFWSLYFTFCLWERCSVEHLGKMFSPDFMCSQTHLFSNARKRGSWKRLYKIFGICDQPFNFYYSFNSLVEICKTTLLQIFWFIWSRMAWLISDFGIHQNLKALVITSTTWNWRHADFLKELESRDAQLQIRPNINTLY